MLSDYERECYIKVKEEITRAKNCCSEVSSAINTLKGSLKTFIVIDYEPVGEEQAEKASSLNSNVSSELSSAISVINNKL